MQQSHYDSQMVGFALQKAYEKTDMFYKQAEENWHSGEALRKQQQDMYRQ